ncbi:MAG: hypothetical protein L3K18_09460 [Thermoplasmata archaeon]|nr:hypothetical protein [Thermoplasmata archaeon]
MTPPTSAAGCEACAAHGRICKSWCSIDRREHHRALSEANAIIEAMKMGKALSDKSWSDALDRANARVGELAQAVVDYFTGEPHEDCCVNAVVLKQKAEALLSRAKDGRGA